MGSNCCKQNAVVKSQRQPNETPDKKVDLRLSRSSSTVTDDANVIAKEQKVTSLKRNANGLGRSVKKLDKAEVPHPRLGGFTKQIEGEHVIAGWPSWLTAVAGEAINGWLPRRADSFEKLDKIGQGTYSNVYRARDLDQKKIVALKKVRFDNMEPESVRFMAREIHILRQLYHPNVIKLEGLVTSRISCSLYLVFEYMEHDLAGLASHPNVKFTESQVKCYMRQLLHGLDHCHSRGVLHRDIKGSNLLIDNNGTLKIADFGLASFYDPVLNNPLTSRVVTLWYRPPELLLGAIYYGTAVDLWSTGCILAELYAGKPIMPGRTEVEQLHKIFKLCGSPSEEYWRRSKLPHATIFKPQQPYPRSLTDTFKEFPSPALSLIETLLSIDPADRGSAASALESEFFMKKPWPCDPASLPKYPPSKELDAKLLEEESRRRVIRRGEKERKILESRAVPAPDANAELAISIKKRQMRSNSKSRSEKFSSHQEDIASGFPIDPPCASGQPESSDKHKKVSHSGPLSQRAVWGKSFKQSDESVKVSDLIAGRRSSMMMRFPGSFKEGSDQEKMKAREGARASRKDNSKSESGSKDHKLHYSGPLLVPNVDQMFKDNDRHIQEAFRRARHQKSKNRTAQGANQSSNSFFSRR